MHSVFTFLGQCKGVTFLWYFENKNFSKVMIHIVHACSFMEKKKCIESPQNLNGQEFDNNKRHLKTFKDIDIFSKY